MVDVQKMYMVPKCMERFVKLVILGFLSVASFIIIILKIYPPV